MSQNNISFKFALSLRCHNVSSKKFGQSVRRNPKEHPLQDWRLPMIRHTHTHTHTLTSYVIQIQVYSHGFPTQAQGKFAGQSPNSRISTTFPTRFRRFQSKPSAWQIIFVKAEVEVMRMRRETFSFTFTFTLHTHLSLVHVQLPTLLMYDVDTCFTATTWIFLSKRTPGRRSWWRSRDATK